MKDSNPRSLTRSIRSIAGEATNAVVPPARNKVADVRQFTSASSTIRRDEHDYRTVCSLEEENQ